MTSYSLGDIDPYNVKDGPWGGFGKPTWFILKDIHPTNVFEWHPHMGSWVRDWDTATKQWRNPSAGERVALLARDQASNQPHQDQLFDACTRQANFAAQMGNSDGLASWQSRGTQVIDGRVTDEFFAIWLQRESNNQFPSPYTAYLHLLALTFAHGRPA